MKILVTISEKSGVSLLTAAFLHSFHPESIIYLEACDSHEKISGEVRQLLYESFIEPYPVFQILPLAQAIEESLQAAIVFSKEKKEILLKHKKISSQNIYYLDLSEYNLEEISSINDWYSLGDFIKDQAFIIFKSLHYDKKSN